MNKNTLMNNNPSTFVVVEVKLGSGRVGAAKISSDTYLFLREQFALRRNNCFRKDDAEGEGVRWNALLPTHYKGWDRRARPIIEIREIPLSTKSYTGRWKDFENFTAEAYGLTLRGHAEKEVIGPEKKTERGVYTPDATDPVTGENYEFKSNSARFRRGQAKRTV